MKKIIFRIFLLGLGIALTAFTANKLINNKKEVEERVYKKNPAIKPLVQVDTVDEQLLSSQLPLSGTFYPDREIDIISQAAGKVIEVGVDKGQNVAAGQLIARLDDDMLQAQLIAAQAQYDKAQLDVKRFENVVAGDALPKVQLEQAQLMLKNAESQLKLLKKQISQHVISAPFAGNISMRLFDFGSVVAPGVPVARLTDISRLKLLVNLPEKELSSIAIGQNIAVRTELYPAQTFSGKVLNIASKADPAHNFEVEILVSNSSQHPLRAGMYGYVQLNSDIDRQALLIPGSALLGSAKNPQVYVVENGIARLRNISLGRNNGEYLQVISGISKGDIVVVSGQVNLSDQVAVSIVQ